MILCWWGGEIKAIADWEWAGEWSSAGWWFGELLNDVNESTNVLTSSSAAFTSFEECSVCSKVVAVFNFNFDFVFSSRCSRTNLSGHKAQDILELTDRLKEDRASFSSTDWCRNEGVGLLWMPFSSSKSSVVLPEELVLMLLRSYECDDEAVVLLLSIKILDWNH